MEALEGLLGETAAKHGKEVMSLRAAHDRHAAGLSDANGAHVTLEDRVKYVEKLFGDSAERHAREVKALKDAAHTSRYAASVLAHVVGGDTVRMGRSHALQVVGMHGQCMPTTQDEPIGCGLRRPQERDAMDGLDPMRFNSPEVAATPLDVATPWDAATPQVAAISRPMAPAMPSVRTTPCVAAASCDAAPPFVAATP